MKKVRDTIQKNSIDDALRKRLWSAVRLCILDKVEEKKNQNITYIGYSEVLTKNTNLYTLFLGYWHNPLERTVDELPQLFDEACKEVRNYFFDCKWYEVYDFIRYTAQNCPESLSDDFIDFCNRTLKRERSAYRFVNCEIVPVTSEEEIESIEEAINSPRQYSGVRKHLETALRLLSDRESPDYRNSVKESILAVEALCKSITGKDKATLGETLNQIEEDYGMHKAFKEALSKLYGYTSDASGIRHASLDESTISYSDAKFMLVSCSAFVNYILGKESEKTDK